ITVCVPKSERELAEERRRAAPPERVTAEEPAFFDPRTGAPRIWFSRGPEGTLRLFDKPGFDPVTGAELAPATPEIAAEWQRQRARERAAARERAEAATRCDALAANPDDPARPPHVPGVPFRELAAHAREAIAACRLAVEARPGEPRYLYQLGRALQTRSRAQALPVLRRAAQAGYGAAFDNIGWIHLSRHRRAEAEDWFRRGAALGDPSCMFSLGALFDQPDDPAAQAVAMRWYRRAARHGHQRARERLDQLPIERAEAARRRAEALERARLRRQQEAAAMTLFMGVLGAAIAQSQRQAPRR
ncbi:MAG: sel1 repeat family protein, partial [Alphaproteobacteria bacterium]